MPTATNRPPNGRRAKGARVYHVRWETMTGIITDDRIVATDPAAAIEMAIDSAAKTGDGRVGNVLAVFDRRGRKVA